MLRYCCAVLCCDVLCRAVPRRVRHSLLSPQPRFVYDDYVQEKRVRSLLCLPMYKKDELQGIVYLENNSFNGAFVSARVPILCVIVCIHRIV